MQASNILVFNKPFKVLSQFKDQDGRATMAEYIDDKFHGGIVIVK